MTDEGDNMSEPQVTKRKVTMSSAVMNSAGDIIKTELTDYVRPDFLDAYVADARTRWQSVRVSDEPDAGKAGYHGQTHIPAELDHPLAGQTFPATDPEEG